MSGRIVAVDVPGKTHIVTGVTSCRRNGDQVTVETWHEENDSGTGGSRTHSFRGVDAVRLIRRGTPGRLPTSSA